MSGTSTQASYATCRPKRPSRLLDRLLHSKMPASGTTTPPHGHDGSIEPLLHSAIPNAGATTQPRRRAQEAPPCRNDGGQVGGVEVLPLGVLVFVIGGLLIANAWGVIDAKFATDAAAHAAVRSYAEAPDDASAQRHAISAAAEAAEGHGRSRHRIKIELRTERGFRRCARVQATVRYEVPALLLPWIGGFGNAFQISSVRSELVDPYRSGLPGIATC